jgi:hypothetical protein
LLLGPVPGLLLDVGLDQLPSDLVAERAGERLKLREGGASGQAVGVDLPSELLSDLGQLRLELIPNGGGVLAHVRGPLQVAGRGSGRPQTWRDTITPTSRPVQTMSCALAGVVVDGAGQ